MKVIPWVQENETQGAFNDQIRMAQAESEFDIEESLVFRESPELEVVLGRNGIAEQDVVLDHCELDHIPVIRRSTGGGTVLIGPGSLVYSLLLNRVHHPELTGIHVIHEKLLQRLRCALQTCLNGRYPSLEVHSLGTCDLTLQNTIPQSPVLQSPIAQNTVSKNANFPNANPPFPSYFHPYLSSLNIPCKFSGNAVRVSRRIVLYHGTILYNFPISLMSRYLREPIRRPSYRGTRTHDQFVANFPASREEITDAITQAFLNWSE